VRRLEAATGMAPVVVAHSMGGLATRRWLALDWRGWRACTT
jgi:alpha-beta hydrolase superfamily lysophospholipase